MSDYEPQGRGVATPRGHEGADLSAKKIAVTGTLLVLFLVAAHFALDGVMHVFARQEAGRDGTNGTVPLAVGPQIPPTPRLQADPKAELDALKAEQKKQLHSYGWMNAAHNSARIPIEDAKALLLQRGLPPVGAKPAPPLAPMPEERKNGYAR